MKLRRDKADRIRGRKYVWSSPDWEDLRQFAALDPAQQDKVRLEAKSAAAALSGMEMPGFAATGIAGTAVLVSLMALTGPIPPADFVKSLHLFVLMITAIPSICLLGLFLHGLRRSNANAWVAAFEGMTPELAAFLLAAEDGAAEVADGMTEAEAEPAVAPVPQPVG